MNDVPRNEAEKWATAHDLDLLAGEMSLRFDGVEAELKEVRTDISELRKEVGGQVVELRDEVLGLRRGLEAVLNVVTSIDEQLRELRTLPARVERLERSRQ